MSHKHNLFPKLMPHGFKQCLQNFQIHIIKHIVISQFTKFMFLICWDVDNISPTSDHRGACPLLPVQWHTVPVHYIYSGMTEELGSLPWALAFCAKLPAENCHLMALPTSQIWDVQNLTQHPTPSIEEWPRAQNLGPDCLSSNLSSITQQLQIRKWLNPSVPPFLHL